LNDKSEDEREGRRLFYCCPFHIFASKSVHLPFADGWVWRVKLEDNRFDSVFFGRGVCRSQVGLRLPWGDVLADG
jgi:hypothetical protein